MWSILENKTKEFNSFCAFNIAQGTYQGISYAESKEELLKAYKERAKLMTKVIGDYENAQ